METRTINTQIDTIEMLIESGQSANVFNSTIVNWLKQHLEGLKEIAEPLLCPISMEYFSVDNPPYTIVTNNEIKKTVVCKQIKESLESKNTQFDPFTKSSIERYEICEKYQSLMETVEKGLEQFEEIIRNGMKFPAELEQIVKAQLSKAVAEVKESSSTELTVSVAQSSLFSPSKVQPQIQSKPMIMLLYKNENQLVVELPDEQTAALFKKQFCQEQYPKYNTQYPVADKNNPCIVYFAAYWGRKGEFTGIFPSEKTQVEFYDLFVKNQTDAFFAQNNAFEYVIYFRDIAFTQDNGKVSLSIPTKWLQAQEPQIVLYKAKNGELAVKFPDKEIALEFYHQMGIETYLKDGKKYPQWYTDNPTTFYFAAYTSSDGKFTGIFTSAAMRDKFFNLMIKNNTDAFTRQNQASQQVIHFNDKAFFQNGGNISVPVPAEWLLTKQVQSMTLKK